MAEPDAVRASANQGSGPPIAGSADRRSPVLASIADVAERLLTLPERERAFAESAVVYSLHRLVAADVMNNAGFASCEVKSAARNLEALLGAILLRGKPVEEDEFLQLIRLLVAIGCWGQYGPAKSGGA